MQLQRDVIDELKWRPETRNAEIGVAAKDGVVTLTGMVPTYGMRLAATRAAEQVVGVRAVADELKVRLADGAVRTDTDIAHAATAALRWNADVPDTLITVKVEDGWVTLHGDVAWQFEKTAAERSIQHLIGVKGVINRINVMPPMVSGAEVQRQIADALKRSATVDANRISVDATGNKVTLRGTVRSWTERSDAESAAWAAPGVTAVEDLIAVGL